ncbi:MAG TPA: DUF6600 domain-containing protein [Steroidobacteraceae bacterium]
MRGPVRICMVMLLLLAGATSIALADESDPPGRVARVSFANGSVSVQPAGMQDWAPTIVNRPLTSGDKLWTDQDSKAELDVGSVVIRLGSSTGFSILNLDDQMMQMNVTAGEAIVHVRDAGPNQGLEVDTPNVAVTLQAPGDYRIEVNDAGDRTLVKVSDGSAVVNATGQTVPIQTQQAVVFTGTGEVSAYSQSMGAPDALDEWSANRDRRFAQSQSSAYVAPDVAGAQDLDQYGRWSDDPDYGAVWQPTTVVAGWAPYRFGHWLWIAPWGWTWVDDAPWGFTPFHYGRWAYRQNSWCWVPGPRRMHPVYAPALVGWRGVGIGVGVVAAGAAVGWFALGPREVYVPAYRVSDNYVRNVNISNTTIVNNTYITNVYHNRVNNITYVNSRAPGAVTTVPRNVFTSAQPVAAHQIHVPQNELAHARFQASAPSIVPVRQSVLGAGAGTSVRRPPAPIANRTVVARVAPPPAPVAFERQEQAIRANGGRPLPRAQMATLEPRAANPRVRVMPEAPVRDVRSLPAQGRPAGTLQGREQVLHATPIPPVPQTRLRTDRPASAQHNQLRQNDLYRAPDNGASRVMPQAHPMPEARPIPESHPMPEARPVPREPVETPRAAAEFHTTPPLRPSAAPRPSPALHPEGSHPRPAPERPGTDRKPPQ